MKSIFLIALFLSSKSAFADCVNPIGTAIYYGNGMFNSVNDAQNGLVELRRLNATGVEAAPSAIQYKLALNTSESDLDNILQVVQQRVSGDLSYFWSVMDSLIPMPDWLKDPILDALEGPINNESLSQMLLDYENDLSSGRKILLVSHSQGNFYAEEAIQRLLRSHRAIDPYRLGFGNVRVATPASTLFSFPYITFPDDQIISWVRTILGAPPPNVGVNGSGLGPVLDPLGHNFIKAYLTNSTSRTMIENAMSGVSSQTQYPCGE